MLIARIRKGKEGKIRNSYPWIFRDEILSLEGSADAVCEVNIFSANYEFLGKGFFSPSSTRAIMVLTNQDQELGEIFFGRLLQKALLKRERLFKRPYYRLVHGEGDRLPGLVVDRYGEILAVQFRNSIMQKRREMIVDLLRNLLNPKGIYERSDFEMGVEDKIERHTGLLFGEVPDSVEIEEDGIKYLVDVKNSQKTGFFFDQLDSRAFCRKITAELSLEKGLDLFSFTGGFGLNMAYSGAEAICVDKSADDLDRGRVNAVVNRLDKRLQLVQSDVLDFLAGFEMKNYFDIVILDPPSFVKHKRELPHGISLFRRLVESTLPLVKDGGVLGICTCAYNIAVEHLVESIRRSTESTGTTFSHLAITLQSPDHPWLVEVPESLYLKCLWGLVAKE
ncbi:MAG TPA: class I SAM-dependent rRNA methyltransferase [Mesotoga infera]|uniref:Class I SAM-dependent rRNA methyltransferase n=1 Tax=Mesotoga infera TaxID=1236046 RepID=A0A7C1GUQ9_9BACT|nr:class I SAM-dependent rRNA methyltransferase [Mesotoga infera]